MKISCFFLPERTWKAPINNGHKFFNKGIEPIYKGTYLKQLLIYRRINYDFSWSDYIGKMRL